MSQILQTFWYLLVLWLNTESTMALSPTSEVAEAGI